MFTNIGRHDPSGAPVEGERGGHHPAVANRHQIRLSGAVLSLEQVHRPGSARGRFPTAVAGKRRQSTSILALSSTFTDAWLCNPFRAHGVRCLQGPIRSTGSARGPLRRLELGSVLLGTTHVSPRIPAPMTARP